MERPSQVPSRVQPLGPSEKSQQDAGRGGPFCSESKTSNACPLPWSPPLSTLRAHTTPLSILPPSWPRALLLPCVLKLCFQGPLQRAGRSPHGLRPICGAV